MSIMRDPRGHEVFYRYAKSIWISIQVKSARTVTRYLYGRVEILPITSKSKILEKSFCSAASKTVFTCGSALYWCMPFSFCWSRFLCGRNLISFHRYHVKYSINYHKICICGIASRNDLTALSSVCYSTTIGKYFVSYYDESKSIFLSKYQKYLKERKNL